MLDQCINCCIRQVYAEFKVDLCNVRAPFRKRNDSFVSEVADKRERDGFESWTPFCQAYEGLVCQIVAWGRRRRKRSKERRGKKVRRRKAASEMVHAKKDEKAGRTLGTEPNQMNQ